MSLRTLAVVLASCASASTAWAWDPLRSAGRSLVSGAGEAIRPVLTDTVDHTAAAARVLVTDVHFRASSLVDQTMAGGHVLLADADARAGKVVDQAGGVASQLIGQPQGALAASVDRIDAALDMRIFQIGGVASQALNRADKILRERSDQLGRLVQDRLAQADGVLSERIDQLDEAVGRRLGNVDVIATKQRLAFEAAAIRVAVLVAVLVFVVFVLLSLWRRYPDIADKVTDKRGVYRAWGIAKRIVWPLGWQLLGAGVALAVLAGFYQWWPLDARKEAACAVVRHQMALQQSLARFDFTRARYHAAQLELLADGDSVRYQAQAAKAELLRDVLARPHLLTSEGGLRTITGRVEDIERKLGATVDPDVLTLKAMVLWQVGSSRTDEYEAASLCTRALRTPGQDFALAPLARHYVRAFLDAPFFAQDLPLDRTHESATAMRTVLTLSPGDAPDFPLAPVLALSRAMLQVDREVSVAYLKMLRAHAQAKNVAGQAARMTKGRPRQGNPVAALYRRRAAQAVLDAWKKFEQTLQGTPGLASNPSVLAVFRLNDATYTRAAWFLENPEATVDELAPLAANLTNLDAARVKVFSPPRVEWERRYRNLVDDNLKGVFAFQEAERFRTFDAQTRAFELAFVELIKQEGRPDLLAVAAQAAMTLGLYVPVQEERQEIARIAEQAGLYLPPNEPDARVPFAWVLLARAPGAPTSQPSGPTLSRAAHSEPMPLAPKVNLPDFAQLSGRHLRVL